jgi:hypothetical protein
MKYVLRHWYDIGLALAFGVLVVQAFAQFDGLREILLLSLVVISLHQYEEYHFPGGGPWLINVSLGTKDSTVDRYPLDQVNALVNNAVLWLFYVPAVIWPDLIWLGLAPVLLGMVGQLLAHGIMVNIRLKTWYNPGLATVLLGHVPLGIWYLITVYRHGTIAWTDWLAAVGCNVVIMAIIVGIGFRLMGSKNSNHPFTPEEMAKFNGTRRLGRLGIPFPKT